MGWPVEPDVSDSGFPEASRWFRKKLSVPAAEWASLSDRARQRAFSVGGVTQLELVQDVWSAIDKAVANGTTLKDFKDEIGDRLARAWGGEDPLRLETVFRQGVQSAYNAGRYEQQNDPAVIQLRPYLRFSAILDSRTTKHICFPAHGTTLPADHPWWATHQPPCHMLCRSTAISLTQDQLEEHGGITADPTQVMPAPGFGGPPSLEWAPQIGKYDPTLATAFLERQDVPPAPPVLPPTHTPEHWTTHYTTQGYGHEAATSLALGRAAQERGLDEVASKMRKNLGALSKDHASLLEEQLAKIPAAKKTATLRELLDDESIAPTEADKHRLRALAALYGHANALGDSLATAKMFTEDSLKVRGSVQKKMTARRIVAQAVARVGPYLSEDAIPPEVEITWKAGRAYQSKGKIVMEAKEQRLKAATLEHEYGHAIEWASSSRLRAADQFLEKRAGPDVPRQLRTLTGKPYGRDEYTHEDRFWDPYVGKLYGRRGEIYGSELTSLGLQWLLDPAMMGQFHAADPEHFLFALGQLADR